MLSEKIQQAIKELFEQPVEKVTRAIPNNEGPRVRTPQERQQNLDLLNRFTLSKKPKPEFHVKRMNRDDLPKGWNYQCNSGDAEIWPISPTVFEMFLRLIGKPADHDGLFKLHISYEYTKALTLWCRGFDHFHMYALAALVRTYGAHIEIEFDAEHPDAPRYAFPRFPVRPFMPIRYQPARAEIAACATACMRLVSAKNAA